SFFDKAEVRDIIAYLRIVANEEDDPAFIRAVTTPKRGVGQASLTALGDTATQLNCSLFDAVHDELAATRIAPRQLEPLKVFVDLDRKSTRLNSSHVKISYAAFCLKKTK